MHVIMFRVYSRLSKGHAWMFQPFLLRRQAVAAFLSAKGKKLDCMLTEGNEEVLESHGLNWEEAKGELYAEQPPTE